MKRNVWQILVVLIAFVLILLKISSSGGTDLTNPYVSCRLILAGEISHLYAYDPGSFNYVSDPVRSNVGTAAGIPLTTALTPYMQTPLWPYVLQPLCGSMNFPAFNAVFGVFIAICFAALIWLTGRHWTTRFFQPQWVLLMALLWIRADPLRDAMELTQTHVIFLLMSLLAIVLARSKRPVWAGVLLALAAAVKITPGFLVIYWLLTKQRKAAVSFMVASVAVFAATVLLTGRTATIDYMHSMSRVSHVLLLSRGNQSFAAWWMGGFYPRGESLTFRNLPLPAALKVACFVLVLLSTIAGAYFDRQLEVRGEESIAPYGAVFAMLGATMFTPITWLHYYIILVIPLILILDEQLRRRSYLLIGLFGMIVALASSPNLLRHAGYMHLPVPDLVRGQFYAGLLTMFALWFIYWRQRGELLQQE